MAPAIIETLEGKEVKRVEEYKHLDIILTSGARVTITGRMDGFARTTYVPMRGGEPESLSDSVTEHDSMSHGKDDNRPVILPGGLIVKAT